MTTVKAQELFFKQGAILTYITFIILLFIDALSTNILKQQKRNVAYNYAFFFVVILKRINVPQFFKAIMSLIIGC